MQTLLSLHALVGLGALSLLACSAAPAPAPPIEQAPTTAFVHVTVVPMDSERLLPDQTVLVRGERIAALGASASLPVPAGARVIEGRGKYLMPGLAEMHAHLTREEDLALYLARGVTTVRNMWGTPMHLAWRERIAKGELLGPRIVTAGPIVDGDDPVHDGSLVVRSEAEADRAVALHRQAGYDFLKVYSRLSAGAFERLLAEATRVGLPVAGHVPRAVGLARAVDAGMRAIEHLNTFEEALQADSSPVRGKWDADARERKMDFLDEAKIPAVVKQLHDKGTWICPTRNLLNQNATASVIRERLERPEMRYVPGFDRAIWAPADDGTPEQLDRNQREVALADRMVRALHAGGVHLLLGTDSGNPLVIPGFTVHEELALFVHDGLSPYEALRAGTSDAAAFLGKAGDQGTVAVGKVADLLLVEGNPLADVAQADRLAGVMVRGRYLGEPERAELLGRAEAFAQGKVDLFRDMPALAAVGTKELSGTYEVAWKDVPFDRERLLVERGADGQRVIRAQSFDPHRGQGTSLTLWPGAAGVGERMVLESDGANGRGRVEVKRAGGKAHGQGLLLSGVEGAADLAIEEGELLGADHFLASKLLLAPRLAAMEVGQTLETRQREVSLGSAIEATHATVKVTRTADLPLGPEEGPGVARRFEITEGKRRPGVLLLDAAGTPLRYEISAHGATLRFRRIGP